MVKIAIRCIASIIIFGLIGFAYYLTENSVTLGVPGPPKAVFQLGSNLSAIYDGVTVRLINNYYSSTPGDYGRLKRGCKRDTAFMRPTSAAAFTASGEQIVQIDVTLPSGFENYLCAVAGQPKEIGDGVTVIIGQTVLPIAGATSQDAHDATFTASSNGILHSEWFYIAASGVAGLIGGIILAALWKSQLERLAQRAGN
jgi:hypothetical protein